MRARGDLERQPLLRSHSSIYKTPAPKGNSALLQTVFNSTNVLLGVGLLSLPLGIKHAGWIFGMLLLLFSAIVTAYTAKILARCLDSDKSLATYADIAYASFGPVACGFTRLLFSFIVLAACVALLILFGDTMHILVPSITALQWKVVCGFILVPLHFIPFHLLSFSSILGVFASFGLVLLTILAGILKPTSPGSLRQPALTSMFPDSWTTLPLSFGLIMSPWGGHASFPNLYRDMYEPQQYGKSLIMTFASTYTIDLSMAVCGFLMYGADTMDEIVANILVTPGHSKALLATIVVLVAIMPITKIPLNSRPLVMMIETTSGLDPVSIPENSYFRNAAGQTGLRLLLARSGLRIAVVAAMVGVAIVCPNFDGVMGFAGSALCFTVCIILPLLFHLKIFQGRISRAEWAMNWVLIAVSVVMATMGTVGTIVPKSA